MSGCRQNLQTTESDDYCISDDVAILAKVIDGYCLKGITTFIFTLRSDFWWSRVFIEPHGFLPSEFLMLFFQ
nr:hypothetical protein 1137p_00111 [Serratia proteamaculans]